MKKALLMGVFAGVLVSSLSAQARLQTLQFVNQTKVPVVLTDTTKDNTTSQMPGHSLSVAPGEEVSWQVNFAEPAYFFGPNQFGFYQLNILVDNKLAAKWIESLEQNNSGTSIICFEESLMLGFDFEDNDDPSADSYRVVFVEDQETVDLVGNLFHGDY